MSGFAQLMMRSKGLKLNANILGNPIIDNDYILKGFNNNNYVYWKLENPTTNPFNWRATVKFKINDLDQTNVVIFGVKPSTQGFKIAYNNDGAGKYGLSCLIGNSSDWINSSSTTRYQIKNVYTTVGEWWWLDLSFDSSTKQILLKKSTDGTTYTNLLNITVSSNSNFANNTEEIVGFSSQITDITTNKADIDLKEIKYYINGNLSFKVVS